METGVHFEEIIYPLLVIRFRREALVVPTVDGLLPELGPPFILSPKRPKVQFQLNIRPAVYSA